MGAGHILAACLEGFWHGQGAHGIRAGNTTGPLRGRGPARPENCWVPPNALGHGQKPPSHPYSGSGHTSLERDCPVNRRGALTAGERAARDGSCHSFPVPEVMPACIACTPPSPDRRGPSGYACTSSLNGRGPSGYISLPRLNRRGRGARGRAPHGLCRRLVQRWTEKSRSLKRRAARHMRNLPALLASAL
jgi:hypothetical protein